MFVGALVNHRYAGDEYPGERNDEGRDPPPFVGAGRDVPWDMSHGERYYTREFTVTSPETAQNDAACVAGAVTRFVSRLTLYPGSTKPRRAVSKL